MLQLPIIDTSRNVLAYFYFDQMAKFEMRHVSRNWIPNHR